ncbi:MAG TPA: PEGA domain-containing protein [Thermotogota bacterium]|nr:PEGA domain-containing protein [Thermotogota bacterium]
MKKILMVTLVLLLTAGFIFSSEVQIQPRKIIITPDQPSTMEASIRVNKGEGNIYQPGEPIQIQFEVNKDSYVVIYDIEADGNTFILFPNNEQRDNFVRANQTVTIPYGYNMNVGAKQGKEYLQIVASTHQFTSYNAWTQSFSASPFPNITKNAENDLQTYTKRIIITPDNTVPEWTSASTYFYVGYRPTAGTVSFNSNPSGASIWVDGSWMNKNTPLKTTLPEGYHYVRFYKSGYQTFETQFYLNAGGYQEITANMVSLTPQYGKLTVNSQPPNSTVYYDGIMKGNTPITLNNLIPGTHQIQIKQTGYETFTQQIQINSGEHKILNANLTKINPLGTVNINTYPKTANVVIDGNYFPNNNGQVQVQLNAGVHSLTVSSPGYQTQSMQFTLSAGDFKQITVQLEESMAEVNLYSNPESADVYIDGNYTGYTTGRTFRLYPGSYSITLKKEGFQDWSTTAVLNSGKNQDIVANLLPLKGVVRIQSNTSCVLYIDGSKMQDLAAGSQYNFELEPGVHEFVFLKPGYYSYTERVNVVSGSSYNIYPYFSSL